MAAESPSAVRSPDATRHALLAVLDKSAARDFSSAQPDIAEDRARPEASRTVGHTTILGQPLPGEVETARVC